MATWTADHLARLEAAIAKGVMSVQYEDRRVTYRSQREMLELRDLMKRELGQRPSRSSRRAYARTDRGLR